MTLLSVLCVSAVFALYNISCAGVNRVSVADCVHKHNTACFECPPLDRCDCVFDAVKASHDVSLCSPAW